MKNWNKNNLRYLHIELSNHCNAACPMCPRYVYHTRTIDPSLTLTQITLDDFKRYFPKDLLVGIYRITFCGTHGDSMTAKDIIPIIEYIHECNIKIQICINTNGGLRSEQFWSSLGTLLKDKDHAVTFSIDGLEDTNHLYRRNVVWNTLIRNVKAFIASGGIAYWDYLIFQHNESQINDAIELSKTLGFERFFSKRALGFSSTTDGTYKASPVYDKNGNFEYFLSPPDNKEYLNQGDERIEDFKFDKIDPNWHIEYRNNLKLDNLDNKYNQHLTNKINCKFLNRDTINNFTELYVNANGAVIPCCFMGSAITGSYGEEQELQVRTIIDNNKDMLNLNNYSLFDILESKILDKLFIEKWKLSSFNEGKPAFCSLTCGENNTIDRIFIKDDL